MKGQVALEFLTTYGWAFLVIVIMMSTLSYFGVLKPSRFLPDRCNFGLELECKDSKISITDSSIKVRLKNNLGEPITVSSIAVSTESAAALVCTAPDTAGTWGLGEIEDFTFTGCNLGQVGFVLGNKGKVSISLSYYSLRSGIEYTHNIYGEIFATVT